MPSHFFASAHETYRAPHYLDFHGPHAGDFDAPRPKRVSVSRSRLCGCCVCAPKTKYWLARAVAAKKYPSPAQIKKKNSIRTNIYSHSLLLSFIIYKFSLRVCVCTIQDQALFFDFSFMCQTHIKRAKHTRRQIREQIKRCTAHCINWHEGWNQSPSLKSGRWVVYICYFW